MIWTKGVPHHKEKKDGKWLLVETGWIGFN